MDSRYYNEIGKAVKRAQENDGDLTTQNLLYIVKIAKNESRKTGIDEDELIAVGTEAMKKVEMKYDKTRNDNFVKACGASVRGEIMNYINRNTNLVHIPVNHQKGFKKGQEAKEETVELSYFRIDELDYDMLGECNNLAFNDERDYILRKGLETLDEYGKKTIMMKLHMDEYGDMKYNNFQVMADELELPIQRVKQIYTQSLEKLTRYCQSEMN